MAWDASFKNFLKTFLNTEVVTELDVPTANLRLDFMMKNNGQLPSPFNHARSLILGEFKSERDKFNMEEFYRSLAKAYLHLASIGHEKKDDLTLMFILGAHIRIPSFLNDDIQSVEPGIWMVQHDYQILIVELDKLKYTPSNEFLGIFASPPIRKKVIAQALRNKERFIISYSYFLFKDEVLTVAEAENVEIDPKSLSIRAAVESIGFGRIIEEVGLSRMIEEVGLSRMIEEVGLSRMIEEVGLSKVIEEVGLSKVIEEVGLEKLLAELSTEQKKMLKELLDS